MPFGSESASYDLKIEGGYDKLTVGDGSSSSSSSSESESESESSSGDEMNGHESIISERQGKDLNCVHAIGLGLA